MGLNETQYNNVPKSSKVFISYSHDSSEHKDRVLQLSNRLRSEGVDCNIDQYETSPSQGWSRWMIDQIDEADYVLIICTKNYERRFKGKEEVGRGLGAQLEGLVITQELYEAAKNTQFIPVVFSSECSNYIPLILKSATRYNLDTEEVYNDLYARLTHQRIIIKPDLGKLRTISSKNLSTSISMQNKEGTLIENSQKPVIGELRKITTWFQSSDTPITFTSPSIDMQFVLIPTGKFIMGSNDFSRGRPVHEVIIKDSFYIGKYHVTQKQWKTLMDNNPSKVKGDNLPIENVSWNDVQEFIKILNDKENTNKYRLPSEAEWEYACRAGTKTKYYYGDEKSKLGDYAWYARNSGKRIHPVGQKKPNSWGLYDMHGNVREWVQDGFHSDYVNAPSDGSAWEGDGSLHIMRGGNYNCGDFDCQSAEYDSAPTYYKSSALGFRLVRYI